MKRLPFRPRAVLFDMDGVVIDSMPYHFISWYEALRPWGVRVNCFDVYSKEGEKWSRTLLELLRREGISPSKKMMRTIFSDRTRIFGRYFKRFVFHDAEQLIACLRERGYPLALVTGTPSPEIKKILPGRIKKYFECIVAGNHVRRGKPYPDPYLKAAKALKVPSSQCLVIENAPFGIESAKRAGMYCIAITTSLPEEYLRKADQVIHSLKEIETSIEQTCPNKTH